MPSRPASWRATRNRYLQTTRTLARLAAEVTPPAVRVDGPPCPACNGAGGKAKDKRGLRWRPCVMCGGRKTINLNDGEGS